MRYLRLLLLLTLYAVTFLNATPIVRHTIHNQTSGDITIINQDSQGFLWIGTNNGLNRFDGWSNMAFTHNREDSTSLKSNMVEALFNDTEGNLWIGSGSGLQRYVPGSGSLQNVTFPGIQALSVRSIVERNKDELLIVTSGYGTFSINTKTMQASPIDALNKIIGTQYAHIIKTDDLNRIWIGAADGRLICVDKNFNKICSTNFQDKVLDIASNKNNEVFVATPSAIYLWKGEKQQFEPLKGTEGWNITGLMKESDGKVLAHTLENGVFRLDTTSIVPDLRYDELKGEGILAMYEDRDGDIWIGTRKGSLAMSSSSPELFQYREIQMSPSVRIETLFSRSFGSGVAAALSDGMIIALDNDLKPEATFPSHGRVTSSCRLHDGTILLGYADGKIMKFTSNEVVLLDKITDREIEVISEDMAGRLYATVNGLGFKYKKNDGEWISVTQSTPMSTPARLGNDWINVITPDHSGNIWIGHYNGIDLFDPKDNKFLESKSIQELRTNIVYAILTAKDKSVWIGTNIGLFHLFPSEDRMDYYGTSEGLIGNVICGIQQANNGDIWCTTNNGISRIRYSDNKVINYVTGNGLGERNYRHSMLFRNAADKLFAVGYNGITAFYPDGITDSLPIAAPVLTHIYINTDEESPKITYTPDNGDISAKIQLKHNQNTFSLEFSTFDYRNPGNIGFEYRIPKLDKEWRRNPVGDNRVVCNYMEPGKYILEIRAIENGQVSPSTSILIEILPPWYLSVWAKIVYFLLLAAAVAGLWYAYDRYRKQQRKDEIAEEKFKMLYNFAHELRSPVTLITSPLTALIQEEKDAQKANIFRMIQRNGYRITNLVNKMLDVRRIEKGQLKLVFSETDLKEYLELIIEDFRHQAQSRKISLSFSAPDESIFAYIDPEHFDKVIVNLISNAFKFTPDGGTINVTLRKIMGRDGKEMAQIEVEDTGTGINADDLGHIFERFYQADRKNKGFGIGLNLSKMLVDMHHGSIQAFNREEGTGARFVVDIPLGKAHLKEKEISQKEENAAPKRYIEAEESMTLTEQNDPNKGSRSYRVLVVDDDDEIRSYLKRELSNTYRIVTAADGEEAYAIAQEKQIDLIVSDIMMPKTDGFELLKKIRGNADLSHIPIILLTTSEDFKTRMTG